MQEEHNIYCIKCRTKHIIKPEQTFWDEHGYGYSTKLCKCPTCNNIIILEYYEDHGLDINKDTRWYN